MAKQPQGIIAMFIREMNGGEHFYPVEFMGDKSPADEAADHAALNPGTLRVETLDGEVIWQAAKEAA